MESAELAPTGIVRRLDDNAVREIKSRGSRNQEMKALREAQKVESHNDRLTPPSSVGQRVSSLKRTLLVSGSAIPAVLILAFFLAIVLVV